MIDNQFNFSHVLVRCSFNDENGNIRTLQGYVMIETSTISYAPGSLVKDDFQLQGNGKLDMFDGFIPCDTAVTDFTVNELTTGPYNIRIDYTYTGSVYQIKYRLNNTGDYVYAVANGSIYINLEIGSYELEIIPVCENGYEGTGFSASFFVTHGEACGTVISDITINGSVTTATAVYTGSATQMKYRVDGGMWTPALITYVVHIGGLSVGGHTIEMVPICSNSVEGTGFLKNFTITTQPNQSVINYDFRFPDSPNVIAFRIYLNGVLTFSTGTTASGMLTAAVGVSVKYEMQVGGGRDGTMTTTDFTTSSTLDTRGGSSSFNVTFSYTFTANGDEFNLDGQINDL